MKVPKSLFRVYLSHITAGYFAKHDSPPESLDGYDLYVEDIRRDLAREGNEEKFRAALDHVLGNTQIDSALLVTTIYPFDDPEVREILRYVREELWPDAGPVPPGGPPDFEFLDA